MLVFRLSKLALPASQTAMLVCTLYLLLSFESLVAPPLLALVMLQVAVACRRPCKLGAAVGAHRLGRLARLFTLVSEQVAKRRELAAVASVLPALRLRPARDGTGSRRSGADAVVRGVVSAGMGMGVGMSMSMSVGQRRAALVVAAVVVWAVLLGPGVRQRAVVLVLVLLLVRVLLVHVARAHHGRVWGRYVVDHV